MHVQKYSKNERSNDQAAIMAMHTNQCITLRK
jgi:hypothetical protein